MDVYTLLRLTRWCFYEPSHTKRGEIRMSTSPLESSAVPDQGAVPFDAHGIEAIPDDSRDCSPWELFWIWSGANIAPINWVLGALGITLGLSLV